MPQNLTHDHVPLLAPVLKHGAAAGSVRINHGLAGHRRLKEPWMLIREETNRFQHAFAGFFDAARMPDTGAHECIELRPCFYEK